MSQDPEQTLEETTPGGDGPEQTIVPSLSPIDKAWVGQGGAIAQQFLHLLASARVWAASAPEMLHPQTGIRPDSLAAFIDRAGVSDLGNVAGFVAAVGRLAADDNAAVETSAIKLARTVGNTR